MTNRAQDVYLSQRVLAAGPLELVRMLYAGASEAVETARARLVARDIRGRAAAISKAMRIVSELAGALDHRRAAELSRNLASLYDYMRRRLLEANLRQEDAPLAEVLTLLRTLAEAWNVAAEPAVEPLAPEARIPQTPWTDWNPVVREPSLHGWSF